MGAGRTVPRCGKDGCTEARNIYVCIYIYVHTEILLFVYIHLLVFTCFFMFICLHDYHYDFEVCWRSMILGLSEECGKFLYPEGTPAQGESLPIRPR